mgnify:CR=1 FL=1
MASRAADATLVKGAAIAYKNYDNDPSVYAGLDKAIQSGIKVISDEAARRQKRTQEINDKADKAFKIDDPQEHLVDKNFTRNIINDQQERWIQAVRDGDKDLQASIENEMKVEGEYIQRYDGLMDGLALTREMGIKAQEGTDHLDILTSIRAGEHSQEFVERDDGEGNITKVRVFTGVTAGGLEYSHTLEELEDMAVVFDPEVEGALVTGYNDYLNKTAGTTFTPTNAQNKINKFIPSKPNSLRGFLYGEIADGQNFSDLLQTDNTRQEVNAALEGDKTFDTDNNGISDEEFKVYVNAVMNPYAEDLNGDRIWANKDDWMKFSRPIVHEKMYNALMNRDSEMKIMKLAEKEFPNETKEEAYRLYQEKIAEEKGEGSGGVGSQFKGQ